MRSHRAAALSIFAGALALSLAAVAVASDPIVERQETMKKIGDSMKALGGMARGASPFDAAAVKSNAQTIAESLDHAKSLFPEGSGQGSTETWAKAEIWTEKAKFDETLKSAHDAAVELASVAEEANYRAALGALGQNCRACHDSYRRPKE